MFDKRKDNDTPPEALQGDFRTPDASRPQAETLSTRSMAVIGSTIKIKGEVRGEENLVIEGSVEGSVELAGHDLTIGPKGHVGANLNAKTIKVEGQITGDIKGEEKVIVTKSGRMLGNIVAPRVTLEDGAKFKGSIDMDPGADMPVLKEPTGRSAGAANTSASTKGEPAEKKRAQTGG